MDNIKVFALLHKQKKGAFIKFFQHCKKNCNQDEMTPTLPHNCHEVIPFFALRSATLQQLL